MAKILIKNDQTGRFLKTLWPKLQIVSTMLISIFMGFSNFSEDSIFFAENFGSAKEASFNTKTAISAMSLKSRVTTCFYLP